MKIISHRGNLEGPNPLLENSIDYIENAISEGFEVEIDLWVEDDVCYLGHDDPQYSVTMEWLRKYKDVLWIHCKNREALEKMCSSVIEFHYFWHETDRYTLTSKGFGLVLVGQFPFKNSVIVMPEKISLYSPPHGQEYIKDSYGIITDYPKKYCQEFVIIK